MPASDQDSHTDWDQSQLPGQKRVFYEDMNCESDSYSESAGEDDKEKGEEDKSHYRVAEYDYGQKSLLHTGTCTVSNSENAHSYNTQHNVHDQSTTYNIWNIHPTGTGSAEAAAAATTTTDETADNTSSPPLKSKSTTTLNLSLRVFFGLFQVPAWLLAHLPWGLIIKVIFWGGILLTPLAMPFLVSAYIRWLGSSLTTAVTSWLRGTAAGEAHAPAVPVAAVLGQISYMSWVAAWFTTRRQPLREEESYIDLNTLTRMETDSDAAHSTGDSAGGAGAGQLFEVASPFLWGKSYISNLPRLARLYNSQVDPSDIISKQLATSLVTAEQLLRRTHDEAEKLSIAEHDQITAERWPAELLIHQVLQHPVDRLVKRQEREAIQARRRQALEAAWKGCDSDGSAGLLWRWACWAFRAAFWNDASVRSIRLETHRLLEDWLNNLLSQLREVQKHRRDWLDQHKRVIALNIDKGIADSPACKISNGITTKDVPRELLSDAFLAQQDSAGASLQVLSRNMCQAHKPIMDHKKRQKQLMDGYLTWLERTIRLARGYIEEVRQVQTKGIFFFVCDSTTTATDDESWIEGLPRATVLSSSDMNRLRQFVLSTIAQKNKWDIDTFASYGPERPDMDEEGFAAASGNKP
ncbi:hypothetical protein VPNG_10331 [Cytospora leucostoma]|uniref:Uncharacterized protein n=1 Tax=Cytospora leucostoma TaxID=1230097 RepID=A0A423VBP4_9PEZI|nr:hypothetical protein VPNG_10331 [Cytospora leucostoma]